MSRRTIRAALSAAAAAVLVLIPAWVSAQSAEFWTAPLGVPAPAFGVRETAPAVPSSWTRETPGFYYVDNTAAASTDSVQYGTPGVPRKTIPTAIAAGSVVEVHGGPYSTSVNISVGGNGTVTAPIFYRGVGKPRIVGTVNNRNIALIGSYVVLEGFIIENLQVAPVGHHQSVRDNEIRGMTPAPGGSAVYLGAHTDIVVLRNLIHNNGDPNYPVENDIHGVLVGTGAERAWIMDNEMYSNGGDSVQINSGTGTLARLIYIARNRMHGEGENAVDIKTAQDVVVSQNRCWGFRPTTYAYSGSDGTAIVVNDDNARTGVNNRIFILFNEISDSTVGVRTQWYAILVGNVIRNIQNAGVLTFGAHDVHIEHNTFYDVARAVERSGGDVGNKIVYINNVVYARTADDMKVTGNATNGSTVANSVFASPARISWAGVMYTGIASFAAARGCSGCVEGDPSFLNVGAADFRPRPGSPLIGNAAPSALYSAYQQTYGVSIAYDALGRSRPGPDGRWDVGALEGDGVNPPAAPANVRIIR
ncbi:MAG TPA: hypothetical protein VFK57_06475 [Vicinamibacterales bacterium]|nr:hypothetical protein [Vicinamibacterales bacterium]